VLKRHRRSEVPSLVSRVSSNALPPLQLIPSINEDIPVIGALGDLYLQGPTASQAGGLPDFPALWICTEAGGLVPGPKAGAGWALFTYVRDLSTGKPVIHNVPPSH
jgi:hypothetical protein